MISTTFQPPTTSHGDQVRYWGSAVHKLGPIPEGDHAISLMRLVVQARPYVLHSNPNPYSNPDSTTTTMSILTLTLTLTLMRTQASLQSLR